MRNWSPQRKIHHLRHEYTGCLTSCYKLDHFFNLSSREARSGCSIIPDIKKIHLQAGPPCFISRNCKVLHIHLDLWFGGELIHCTTLVLNFPQGSSKDCSLVILLKTSKKSYSKLVTCQERLLEADVRAAEHHPRIEGLRQFFNEISVGSSVHIKIDSYSNIPRSIDSLTVWGEFSNILFF